jgi:hypothetical protein
MKQEEISCGSRFKVIWTAGSSGSMQTFFVSHYDTGEKEMPAHSLFTVDRSR